MYATYINMYHIYILEYSVTQYKKLDLWGSIDNKLCLVDRPLQMPAMTMPSVLTSDVLSLPIDIPNLSSSG